MQTKSFLLLSTLSVLLIFSACAKKGSSSGQSTSSAILDTGKKGADFSTNSTNGTWQNDVFNLKSWWFYNWGTPLPTGAPQNCQFVSMFWGQSNVTQANIDSIIKLKDAGTVKYVLGFNEPDQSGQSNMTVSQALALWPQLESIGLPLGSPAVSYPTVQWFTDFMDSVAAENLRVDFICVHMYVGTDDVNFVQVLQQLYNQYHLPIWVTEFATADWNATTVPSNTYTPAEVLGFMQRLLPQLDSLSYVQRYSWFSGDPASPQLWSSALVDSTGGLTTLGAWYANYLPNTHITQ